MIYHRRINRATASKFSKIVINMQSFLQIIYHSITTEVVSVDIQLLQAMIQDIFLYHSSITPKTWYFYHITENQPVDIFFPFKKHIEQLNKQM